MSFEPYRKTMRAKDGEGDEPEEQSPGEQESTSSSHDWSLLEEIPRGIMLLAPTGEVLFLNQRAQMMLSVELEPLQDVDELFVLLGEKNEPAKGTLGALFARLLPGEEVRAMTRLRVKGVRQFQLDARLSSGGDTIVVSLELRQPGTSSDFNELTNVILAFKALVSNLPRASVLLFDHDLRFMLGEGSSLGLAGYTPGSMFGHTLSEVVSPKDFEFLVPSYERALAGFPTEISYHSRKVGRDYHVQFLPISNRSGAVIAGCVFILEITQFKRLERQLERKTAQLELVNKDLEELAYISSHDLRAPLRRLKQLTQWTREELGDSINGEVERYTTLMLERFERLEAFHDSLLRYVRAGRHKDEPQAFLLDGLVRSIWEDIQAPDSFTLRLRGVEDVSIYGSVVTYSLIFAQLLSNALQHHDREQGWVEVEYRLAKHDHELIVRDDGPGIPLNFHERVFRVTERLAFEREGRHRGLGIGLAMVRRLAGVHGGSARVLEQPPSLRGVAIAVNLPVEASGTED